jgi:hypothetical protein
LELEVEGLLGEGVVSPFFDFSCDFCTAFNLWSSESFWSLLVVVFAWFMAVSLDDDDREQGYIKVCDKILKVINRLIFCSVSFSQPFNHTHNKQ